MTPLTKGTWRRIRRWPISYSNRRPTITNFKFATLALGATLALAACGTTNENNVAWHKPGVTQAQANLDEQQCRQQENQRVTTGSMQTANGTRIQEYKNCISARGYKPGELARNEQIGFMEF